MMIKKYILLAFITCVLLLPDALSAQHNSFLNYSKHFSNHGSQFQPSRLGSSYETGYISPLYVYAYAGNSSFDLGTLSNNLGSTEGSVDDLYQRSLDQLGQIDDRHLIGFGLDIQFLFMSYKIHRDEEELLTLSFGINRKITSNLIFSENLYKLLRRGNKQFEGQKTELGPFGVNYLYSREYSLGAAAPFTIDAVDERLTIRPGIRTRYVQGFVALMHDHSELTMHTHENGRAIEFEGSYRYNASHPSIPDFSDADALWLVQDATLLNLDPTGHGYGIDAGVSLEWDNKYNLTFSMIDMGNIYFKEGVINYHYEGSHAFNGMNVHLNRFVRGQEEWYDDDITDDVMDYNSSEEAFTMPLGAKMVLQGELNFFPQTTSYHEYEYTMSNIFITYVRGFSDHLDATTRPYYSLAYSHDFWSFFNAGASYSYGGYNRGMFGTFASIRLGSFRIGAGSNNLTALFNSAGATGMDGSFVISGAF